MQNSYHMLGNKFKNLYFYAKFKVKSKKCDTLFKTYDNAERIHIVWLETYLTNYTFMQNLRLK